MTNNKTSQIIMHDGIATSMESDILELSPNVKKVKLPDL